MNFRQIDCFLAVAESLSFSAAAGRLYLSQSAVSQQVASFESELGYPLFHRTKHKVTLTKAGAFLYPRLAESRDMTRSVFDRAASIARDEKPRLTLGYDGPIAEGWVSRALPLVARSSGFSYGLRRASMPELSGLLLDGSVDFIVTTDHEAGTLGEANFHALLSRGPCVFFPRGHRFEGRSAVTVEDLEGETLVTAYEAYSTKVLSKAGSLLMGRGVSIRDAVPYLDGDTAFLAVQAGQGVFVASHLCDEFAEERYGLMSADLDAGLPKVTMGVAWKTEDPAIDAFVKAAESIVRSASRKAQLA